MRFRLFGRRKEKQVDQRSAVKVKYAGEKPDEKVTTSDAAMANSVFYRGVSILSDAVASVPLDVYRRGRDGYWSADASNPLSPLFRFAPNARQTVYEFLEGIVVRLIADGNAYVLIRRGGDSDVSSLVLLSRNSTMYDPAADIYTVADVYNKINGVFRPDSIIHIRHKSLGGWTGDPVVRYAGTSLAVSKSSDTAALTTYGAGGKFKGILTSESSLTGFSAATDTQVDEIRDNLQAQVDSGRDIITMQSGATFTPMSQTLRDLSVSDIKSVTLSDIARYLGVSPQKLGILMGGNYQASLQDSLNFYNDTLNPLLVKIEKAFTAKLIAPALRNRYKIEFDRTSLTYFKEILANYEKESQLGLLTVNDIRKKFNMPKVDGGDSVLVTANVKPVTEFAAETDTVQDNGQNTVQNNGQNTDQK